MQILKAQDGAAITALAMDDLNNEGLAGTSSGSLYYLNFAEKLMIKLVSKAYPLQRAITSVAFIESNPHLFLTSCASEDSTVKLWTSATCDQVTKF